MSLYSKFRSAGTILYTAYAWLVLALVVAPVLPMLLVTPRIVNRRRIAKRASLLVFGLFGMKVRVSGAVPDDCHACVLVANHASYLDGILLQGVLNPQFQFLIKREMASMPVAGFILRRLDAAFVDRNSAADRHRIARRLLEAARRGRALALFPEGTFDELPGLKRFHSGAFSAAWRAGLPVVPVTITGTRRALPAETVLMTRTGLHVHIGEPIDPEGFESAQDLLAAARETILSRLDEPDLDPATPRDAVDGVATSARS